jgi:hypothetical protein
MDDTDLAAVRPAYRLLRSKLADLDLARSRLQELIAGFEGLYPTLAQEEDRDETPEGEPDEKHEPEKHEPEPMLTGGPMLEEPVSEPSPDGIPRGKQAIAMIMAEQPTRWFTAADVLTAMDKHGWRPKSETEDQALRAVRTAVRRAIRAGWVESRPIDGRAMMYRYRSPVQPAEVIPSVT